MDTSDNYPIYPTQQLQNGSCLLRAVRLVKEKALIEYAESVGCGLWSGGPQ